MVSAIAIGQPDAHRLLVDPVTQADCGAGLRADQGGPRFWQVPAEGTGGGADRMAADLPESQSVEVVPQRGDGDGAVNRPQ